MSDVNMELASVEQHDNEVHKAVARRAYTLYERDGLTDGHDQEHWLRAERELTVQDVPFSIENDAVVVRLANEVFPASILVVSVSTRSVLIFRLKDDANTNCQGINRECVHIISLPVEVDTAGVTCELDDGDFALRLPLVANIHAVSNSACV